ncbi:MAG TPA: acyl-CoA dehydrogenase [Acidimicrobiia bacterium]|nr:acyl-CoA dehydrogenase [Acidimicrobiia bacterium]
MDFTYPAEAEAFRKEFRTWLDGSLTDDLRELAQHPVGDDPDRIERLREWNRTLADARYAAIAWPPEYGGRGASLMEQVVYAEEMHRAGAPGTVNIIGLSNIAPAIMEHGTEEQKRDLLPRMLRGDDIWCQGFSEPGAGSDLAGLRTRAVDEGDHFIVNGQKVWTSGAQFADWIYLLVRTDPAVPKHRGISFLLVDMKTPGITVRPLVLMNGHQHFNEVFFVDVAVPKENLVGPVNQGWKVAMTTLMYERKGGGGRGHDAQIARLGTLARQMKVDGVPAWDNPLVRQRFAQLVIDATTLKYTRFRNLTRQLRGEPPGPEGSILKLFGSELGVHIADFAGELLGPRVLVNQPSADIPDAPRWFNRVVSARQYTIAGGTSEIQRNIIGERVLGLPKD